MMFGSRIVNSLPWLNQKPFLILAISSGLIFCHMAKDLTAAPLSGSTVRIDRQLEVGLPFDPESEARYRACLAALKPDPVFAVEYARGWQEEGGGFAAIHCLALALYHQGHIIAAASTLHNLAQDMSPLEGETSSKSTVKLRSLILDQAGVLYDLGGDGGSAVTELTRAIKLNSDDPELLIDRAIILGKQSNWRGALSDLDLAVQKMPRNLASPSLNDALLLRATALRHLGEFAAARQGIDQILSASPQHQGALIESGNLFSATGNVNGARRAWLAALAVQDQGEMAELARSLLQTLELNRSKK
ncbi:MAG: hypothetical protein QM523_01440 [Candidatus Pacebacteria bacterium]|nr:hypothetical protein [Candidatus Paceibacterota bacterium]